MEKRNQAGVARDPFRLGTPWGPSLGQGALDLLALAHRCSPGGI